MIYSPINPNGPAGPGVPTGLSKSTDLRSQQVRMLGSTGPSDPNSLVLWSRLYTFIPGSLAGCMNVGWNHEWTDSSCLSRSQYVDAQSHFSVPLQSAFDENTTGSEGAFKLVIFFGIEDRRGPICVRCTCFQ